MKKLLTLTCVGVIAGAPAFAGPAKSAPKNLKDAVAFAKQQIHAAVGKRSDLTLSRVTALDSRLVSSAAFTFNASGKAMNRDTVNYFYKAGRGGDLTTVQQFDSAIAKNWNAASAKWVDSAATYCEFNSASKPTKVTVKIWDKFLLAFAPASRDTFTYNAKMQKTADVFQEWSGTAWENSYMDHYTYDAAGNQVADTAFQWNTSSWDINGAMIYTYSASNKMLTQRYMANSTFGWIELYNIKNVYNSSDSLISSTIQLIDASTLTLGNYAYITYTLNASGDAEMETFQMWDGTSWVNAQARANTFDAAHNAVRMIDLEWDDLAMAYDTTSQTLSSYNGYRQLTSVETQQYDAGAFVFTDIDTRDRYHYEEFTRTGIKEKASAAFAMSVYPVPATSTVEVKFNAAEINGSAMVQITDLSGRTLKTAAVKNNTGNVSIDVQDLAAGNYFVSLIAENARQTVMVPVVR